MSGGGGGFQNWGELRAHLIDAYNETPRAETEAVIIEAYEAHPAALEATALTLIVDLRAGTIRSGWAVLRSRAGSITSPPSNPARSTGIDREKAIARAEQWIRNAGIHYDDPDEVADALFGEQSEIRNSPLRAYAQVELQRRGRPDEHGQPTWLEKKITGDTRLVQQLLHLWAEERPRGIQAERDAISRAETWKARHQLQKEGSSNPSRSNNSAKTGQKTKSGSEENPTTTPSAHSSQPPKPPTSSTTTSPTPSQTNTDSESSTTRPPSTTSEPPSPASTSPRPTLTAVDNDLPL